MAKEELPDLTFNSNKYPADTLARAFDMYMTSTRTMREIASELDVPHNTVLNWARKDRWAKRKRAESEALAISHQAAHQALIAKNAMPIMERQLDASEKIEKGIISRIEQDTDDDGNTRSTAKELKELGQALDNSAGVSARIIGLDKSTGPAGQGNLNVGHMFIQVGLRPSTEDPDDDMDAYDLGSEEFTEDQIEDFPDID